MLNSGKTKKGLSANLRKTPFMFNLLSAAALLVLLIVAAINIILGVVLIYNPFKAAILLFRVLGMLFTYSSNFFMILHTFLLFNEL